MSDLGGDCRSQWVCQIRFGWFIGGRLWEFWSYWADWCESFFIFDMPSRPHNEMMSLFGDEWKRVEAGLIAKSLKKWSFRESHGDKKSDSPHKSLARKGESDEGIKIPRTSYSLNRICDGGEP